MGWLKRFGEPFEVGDGTCLASFLCMVCSDYLVIGTPKDTPYVRFGVDLPNAKLAFTDETGQPAPYYLREGVYVVSEEAGLELFDIEDVYQELTYVVDLTEKS
ncbi:hypothetical protein ACS6YF_06080 [Streptococcus suis]